MSLTSKIRRQGGAAIMTIPPARLKLLEVDIGAELTISVEKGQLVARPTAAARKRYSMAELLKGAAGMKRLTADVAWAQDGDPVGKEIA